MRRVVFLDTGILGMVTNPRKYPEVRAWLQRLGTAGIEVWVRLLRTFGGEQLRVR
jgi:hypothetical protein